MRNIAANHHMAGMDGIRHILRPMEMEQSSKTYGPATNYSVRLPPLSQVAVTICSGRHYLLTEIEWRISQITNDDICLTLCLLFIICCNPNI